MSLDTKKCARIPCVTVDAVVSLDEFSIEEITEYLHEVGETASSIDGCYIASDDLSRIETLAVCGQLDAAREIVLRIVSDAIGRTL